MTNTVFEAWRLRGWLCGLGLALLGCTAEIAGNSSGATPQPTGSGGSQSGGGSAAGGSSPQTDGNAPPFAPAAASFKRLTQSELKSSLVALLGPVALGDVEPDTWLGGFAKVGGSTVSISRGGVRAYVSAIEAATAEVFADSARRDALVGCVPQGTSDTACFRSFVERFGRLAWRQALSPTDSDRLTTLAGTLSQSLGSATDGLRKTADAILLSPNFLYRLERGAPQPGSSFWRYTGYEVASRLAFFLTNAAPDEALLAAAEHGRLDAPEGIRAEAERVLATAAGRESAGNFVTELFHTAIINGRPKDPTFTSYTPSVQAAMIREIPAMFEDLVFDQGAPATDIFRTHTTFVNADLAKLYGLDATGLTSDSWLKVTLPADGLRAGYLGTGAFLAQFANQKEGSPTLRGKFIRTALFCQAIPDPPKDVSPVFADPPPGVVLTKRQKLEQHRAKGATCSGCHSLMDPLGLPLENFDAIGAFRQTDQGQPIDVSGELDGVAFNGPLELGQQLSQNETVAACLVRNLYRYATGVLEEPAQEAAIVQLVNEFKTDGRDFKRLTLALVSGDGFRYVAPAQ